VTAGTVTAAEPVIRVAGLEKSYGETRAVDGVSFEVRQGTIFGLLGPNGAGKTTTVEVLEGLREPDAGEVRILGLDAVRQADELRTRIGVSLQTAALYPKLTVVEVLDLFRSFYPRGRTTDELVALMDLGEKRTTRTQDLSGGQRQRLSVALALVNDPELVFLDELTTGLDPQARRAIWELVRGIRARGKTVFLTTHLMEEAERLCDRVAILDHGRIVDIDTPAGLVRRYCPERTVVLVTDDRSAEARFRVAPGVAGVSAREHELEIRGQGDELVTTVIGILSEDRIPVRDLRTERPTLEDVFLKVTGHSIRD
jgi:ABC-2 type transport system ATP-binding protein